MPDSYMRKKWLESSPGMTLFAIGITATMLSLAVFALQDLTILITGKFAKWSPLRDVGYVIGAGIAALFCAFTGFIRLHLEIRIPENPGCSAVRFNGVPCPRAVPCYPNAMVETSRTV